MEVRSTSRRARDSREAALSHLATPVVGVARTLAPEGNNVALSKDVEAGCSQRFTEMRDSHIILSYYRALRT
jgi:hypothetical protein